MYLHIYNTSTLQTFTPSDLYIAYLPLAHILELLTELTMLVLYSTVQYSTVQCTVQRVYRCWECRWATPPPTP